MSSGDKAQAGGKVNILVVDDRADKLLTYEAMLSQLDENLVRATSGKEALRCLLKQDFAVILLDVNMPGMDGFETAKLIRERPRNEGTPIIFISAVNDTENHVSRGYSLGAVDYILTPVVPEILRAKISVFVDLYRKTEQVKRQADERANLIREQAARVEAERQQERLTLLADASSVLASSLDYEETFRNLTRIIVPRLADCCIIAVCDDPGELRQVAATCAEEFRDRVTFSAANHGATKVLRTGSPEMCCDALDELLDDLFDADADRAMVRALEASAIIAVPLRTHDRVLGLITMLNVKKTRACGPNELSLIEQVAERAAIAIENAALYKAAHAARLEAERANLAKDRFLAMLSHELRTPLTPVLASICALEFDTDISEPTQQALQVIRRNVELEARLIDDLLDLTRVSKGKVQLNIETVDAESLLRNALEIFAAEIEQKNLSVTFDFRASNANLRADPARVQQIFWNLIKNAVKFTPAGGRVMISAQNEADQLRVEVADTGRGISADLLPKIFKAFEQGDGSTHGGLGLGLAITKALVETHGGMIRAESDGPDRGAKFVVSLPTSTEGVVSKSSLLPTVKRERTSARILLVEDHEDTQRSLTKLLERRGYAVRAASSVASALHAASTEQFDVLISDIGLPDGSGTDLMGQLQHAQPLFSIALTGYGMEEDVRRSHEVGFDHHLIKPVDLNKLDTLLQTIPQRRAEAHA